MNEFEELVTVIHDEVEGMTVSGDNCPECGSEDYFGHIDLIHFGSANIPGLRMITDCLECGYSDVGNLRFSKM